MTTLTARIGEIVVGRAPDELEALALGSCVAIALYDPVNKIGSLSHVLLPESSNYKVVDKAGKYADTAIPEAIRLTVAKGANRERLRAKIAGGAKMFEMTGVNRLTVDVGSRNVESVRRHLKENGIPIVADDTGQNFGRTVNFSLETAVLSIRMGARKQIKHI